MRTYFKKNPQDITGNLLDRFLEAGVVGVGGGVAGSWREGKEKEGGDSSRLGKT